MASITWTDVTNMAPELSTVSAGLQAMILDYANGNVNTDNFDGEEGEQTKLARVALAAHFATLITMSNSGQAGPITMEKGGDNQVMYGNLFGSPLAGQDFGSTGYGVLFVTLARASKGRILVV